jgi:5-methyltetrahydropteroyltriglutamate--homocysteine methyltransferase
VVEEPVSTIHTGIPTEPIGSIPRPRELIEASRAFEEGLLAEAELDALGSEAVRDTVRRFQRTGSPVISDGEQTKFHNFANYGVHGPNFAPDGFRLQFVNHVRQWPRLTSGPFRFLHKGRRLPRTGHAACTPRCRSSRR